MFRILDYKCSKKDSVPDQKLDPKSLLLVRNINKYLCIYFILERQGSTRRSVKEFAKAFNNDTQVPPAIRQAQKEAERQKQILAVLEREQKQFEEMQKSSEAFRRKVREEQAKKENLEKQRAAMLSQPPGMLSILVHLKTLHWSVQFY